MIGDILKQTGPFWKNHSTGGLWKVEEVFISPVFARKALREMAQQHEVYS